MQILRDLAFNSFKTYAQTVVAGEEHGTSTKQSKLDITGEPKEFKHQNSQQSRLEHILSTRNEQRGRNIMDSRHQQMEPRTNEIEMLRVSRNPSHGNMNLTKQSTNLEAIPENESARRMLHPDRYEPVRPNFEPRAGGEVFSALVSKFTNLADPDAPRLLRNDIPPSMRIQVDGFRNDRSMP